MNTIFYRYIKIHKSLEISNTANQIKYLSFKNHNTSKPTTSRLKKGLAPLKISIMDSSVCVVSSKFWERTGFLW